MYQNTYPASPTEPPILLPPVDRIELKILEALRQEGGRTFRTSLRSKIKGSNTTFMKKIEGLKEKGIIEEFKTREESGRMKTAYSFTQYASRLFELEDIVKMRRWFSASERIELFPEFDKIARALIGDDFSVYDTLGIQPQYLSIETILATSIAPRLSEEQIKELLPMINAHLQNIVTSQLHPETQETTQGYIIFHYRLEQPKAELEKELLTTITTYVSSTDPLEQNKAIGKLTELGIKHPELYRKLTLAGTNMSTSLKFQADLVDLKQKHEAYLRKEEPLQLTRIQLSVAILNIFKKLHELYQNLNHKTEVE